LILSEEKMKYAANTHVTPEQSRMEIERILSRYGATAFAYAADKDKAMIQFAMANRMIRFTVHVPKDAKFTTPTGRPMRNQKKAIEQTMMQRWRSLALGIKAKLELVENGASIEEEFLSRIVLPDGTTVGDFIIPQLAEVYARNEMPKLLSAGF
jgi:hypothetical protein